MLSATSSPVVYRINYDIISLAVLTFNINTPQNPHIIDLEATKGLDGSEVVAEE